MVAFLLKLLGFPFRVIAAVIHWAGEDLRQLAIVMLTLALIIAGWSWHGAASDRDSWKDKSEEWERAAYSWKAAHDTLARDVDAAQREAAEADRAHIADVQQQFQTIIERTADDYQARLADTRAALERVRGDLARVADAETDRSDGGGAAVPAPYTARCRALGAADCDALLTALPDRLAAAEDNTAKLIGLQDYTRSMLGIDWDGKAKDTK